MRNTSRFVSNAAQGAANGKSANLVISPLESVHINITNLTAFVEHIEKHLPTFDKHIDEVHKDFLKALRNVVAFASLIPDLLTADLSKLISDPKKMLDIGQLQAANLWDDVRIIYYFCLTSLDAIGKDNQSDKVLLVMPLMRFIFTKEGDPESMERIAKRFVEHAPIFLNSSRDRLVAEGKYKGDPQNSYTSKSQDTNSTMNDDDGGNGTLDMNKLLNAED